MQARGRTTTRLLTAVGLVLAVVGGALAGPWAATAAEGDVTVVWPATTHLNPDRTTYDVGVSAEDVSVLRFEVGGVVTPVQQAGGSTTVAFPDAGGAYYVRLQRCSPDCVTLEQRLVHSHRRIDRLDRPDLGSVVSLGPGHLLLPVRLAPSPAELAVEWQIRASDASDADVLDAGAGTADVRSDQSDLPMDSDLDLEHGEQYFYTADLVAETQEYGTLTGRVTQWFEWDEAVDATVSMVGDVFYSKLPERDRLRFTVAGDDWDDAVATVADQSGDLGTFTWTRANHGHDHTWGGGLHTTGKGHWRLTTSGRYTVTVALRDRFGNRRDRAFRFRIDDDTPHRQRWYRDVSPARSLTNASVGRCSALRRPADGGIRGSLGLYSQTKCARTRHSVVSTVHRLRLPRTVPDDKGVPQYDKFNVTVVGGRARGERWAYLVMYYWDGDEWRARTELDGDRGRHSGPMVGPAYVQHTEDGRSYAYWSVGLTAGSRYDVQKFEVGVSRWIMR